MIKNNTKVFKVVNNGTFILIEDNGNRIWSGKEADRIDEIEKYIIDNPEALIDEPEEYKDARKQQRIAEIKAECDLLDAKSIRPMRDGETELVAEIKAQIAVLREEYNRLTKEEQ